jgi:hypothetical protein
MEKTKGKEFKLLLKVEAPVGGRKSTTLKELKHILNKSSFFTPHNIDFEKHTMEITYHEYSKEELQKSS